MRWTMLGALLLAVGLFTVQPRESAAFDLFGKKKCGHKHHCGQCEPEPCCDDPCGDPCDPCGKKKHGLLGLFDFHKKKDCCEPCEPEPCCPDPCDPCGKKKGGLFGLFGHDDDDCCCAPAPCGPCGGAIEAAPAPAPAEEGAEEEAQPQASRVIRIYPTRSQTQGRIYRAE